VSEREDGQERMQRPLQRESPRQLGATGSWKQVMPWRGPHLPSQKLQSPVRERSLLRKKVSAVDSPQMGHPLDPKQIRRFEDLSYSRPLRFV
jgi:hypothetical protein